MATLNIDEREEEMSLGQRIKAMRLNRGETAAEFAKHFEASKGTISKWENGNYRPSPERLRIMAKLGSMTVDELLYKESEKERELRAYKAFATDLQRVADEFDLRQRNANSIVRGLKDLLNSLDETLKEIK